MANRTSCPSFGSKRFKYNEHEYFVCYVLLFYVEESVYSITRKLFTLEEVCIGKNLRM